MPPGRLIVLNLFFIGFIGYVMLFALSQVCAVGQGEERYGRMGVRACTALRVYKRTETTSNALPAFHHCLDTFTQIPTTDQNSCASPT